MRSLIRAVYRFRDATPVAEKKDDFANALQNLYRELERAEEGPWCYVKCYGVARNWLSKVVHHTTTTLYVLRAFVPDVRTAAAFLDPDELEEPGSESRGSSCTKGVPIAEGALADAAP